MMKAFPLAKIVGLEVTFTPAALLGTLLLWALFIWAGSAILHLPAGEAVLGGLAATLLHWLADFLHQCGHAWAARCLGYPMTGVCLGQWLIFSTSRYPPDEPELPPEVHIRRALVGPLASLFMAAGAGLLAWVLHPPGGLAFFLVAFFSLDNLGAGLGAFIPLGWTDGSTLLRSIEELRKSGPG